MPRRRPRLLGAGASLLALAGCAPKRTPVIGFLTNVAADATEGPYIDGLRVGLREHGLIEGGTVHIEWRFGDGSNDRVPALVADLLSRGVDVIVAKWWGVAVRARGDPSRADRRDQRRGPGRARRRLGRRSVVGRQCPALERIHDLARDYVNLLHPAAKGRPFSACQTPA